MSLRFYRPRVTRNLNVGGRAPGVRGELGLLAKPREQSPSTSPLASSSSWPSSPRLCCREERTTALAGQTDCCSINTKKCCGCCSLCCMCSDRSTTDGQHWQWGDEHDDYAACVKNAQLSLRRAASRKSTSAHTVCGWSHQANPTRQQCSTNRT